MRVGRVAVSHWLTWHAPAGVHSPPPALNCLAPSDAPARRTLISMPPMPPLGAWPLFVAAYTTPPASRACSAPQDQLHSASLC